MGRNVQTHPKGYDALKMKQHCSQKRFYIGIDTGVNTGFAIWDAENRRFDKIDTLKIHQAFRKIELLICNHGADLIHVRFEDARLRTWFGKSGREQLQGAGSIKRDCSIWEDFLKDLKVSYEPVAPRNNMTKLGADTFEKMTGYKGKTNNHSRDAAMLVFGK